MKPENYVKVVKAGYGHLFTISEVKRARKRYNKWKSMRMEKAKKALMTFK